MQQPVVMKPPAKPWRLGLYVGRSLVLMLALSKVAVPKHFSKPATPLPPSPWGTAQPSAFAGSAKPHM